MKPVSLFPAIIVGLILLLDSQSTNGQNFRAIKADAEYCFYNSSSYNSYYTHIITYKIDTTIYTNGDVYYYNFKQIRPTSNPDCYTPDGSSWLGDPVIEKPDGTFLFRSVDFSTGELTDTIFIKTQATINQKWHLYNYPGTGDYMEAEVTAIQDETFIGIYESVKTFTLTRRNSSGSVVPDFLNGQEIKLSKHFGLIRLPRFDSFPGSDLFYDIIGKTNPVNGVVTSGIKDIYDFEPGDEFHIHTLFSSFLTSYCISIWDIKRVTGKSISPSNDWIAYQYQVCSLSKWGGCYGIQPSYSKYQYELSDTVFFNIENEYKFSREPLESIISIQNNLLNNNYGFFWHGILAKAFNESFIYHQQPGGCWKDKVVEFGCDPYYLVGLGGPYYDCNSLFIGVSHVAELLYYKKGNETWGNPLSCDSLLTVGLKDLTRTNPLTVSPNPTDGIVTVTLPEGMQSGKFELFDLSGRRVAGFSQKQETERFDISCLPAGIYFCKFRSANGEVYQGKIIRQ